MTMGFWLLPVGDIGRLAGRAREFLSRLPAGKREKNLPGRPTDAADRPVEDIVAAVKRYLASKGLDETVQTQVVKAIASEIPAETLAKFTDPRKKRVVQQLTELMREDPNLIPNLPEILDGYDFTPDEFAALYVRGET